MPTIAPEASVQIVLADRGPKEARPVAARHDREAA